MNDEDRARYWIVRVHKRAFLGTLLVLLIGGGVYIALPRYLTPNKVSEESRRLQVTKTALELYYRDHGRYPDVLSRETLRPYIVADYVDRLFSFLEGECVYIPDTKAVTFVLAWRGPDGQFQVDRAAVESATNCIALNLYLESIRFPMGDVFKSGNHCR